MKSLAKVTQSGHVLKITGKSEKMKNDSNGQGKFREFEKERGK